MISKTRRSDFNRGNMGHYSRLDRAIDDAKDGRANITSVIGPWEEPEPRPAPRPLRDGLSGQPSTADDRLRVRVYAHSQTGEHYLGLALSEATLRALVEQGYLEAEAVTVRGRIYGRSVERTYEKTEVA